MGSTKWIGGILGYMIYGPLGALAGLIIGTIIDKVADSSLLSEENDDSYDTYQRQQRNYNQGQRNSLLFSMLVLSSYVIRADGKVMHSEMECVRGFLRANFGESAVSQGDQILRNLFEQQKQMDQNRSGSFSNTIRDCARQMSVCMPYEQRLQLLAFLFEIAKADGKVVSSETDAVKEIGRLMNMSDSDIDSMLNLGGNSLEEAYKVLGIDASATDDEVRKAYKAMVLKHHPDKVSMLGEDIRKAAEKKFKEIGQAKDIIFKARGMS